MGVNIICSIPPGTPSASSQRRVEPAWTAQQEVQGVSESRAAAMFRKRKRAHPRSEELATNRAFHFGALVLTWVLLASSLPGKPPEGGREPSLLVVMDPLAKELACACVKGHAQRDYRKLLARLQTAIKQPIGIEFSDDLAESLAGAGSGRQVIVVGEQSLVARGAKKAGLKCHPVCELTDLDGNTTLTGWFIARFGDLARELKDIGGRKLFVGLGEGDELHAIILAALRRAGVESAQPENRPSYTEAALDLLDSTLSPPPVAVIPAYAL